MTPSETNIMNIIVGDGEVQEYDDASGFSLVDSSLAWEHYAWSTDDCGAVDFSKDHEILCSTSPFAEQDVDLQWGSSSFEMHEQPSSAAPASASATTSCRRSIRDILREVTVSEEKLYSAVARLGGGAQGLQVLMDHVYHWASSEHHDADITATIRKGIADLGNMPPHHSTSNAHLQWKHYSNRGGPWEHALGNAVSIAYTSPAVHWENKAMDQSQVIPSTTGCEPMTHRGSAYTRALQKSHIVRQRKNLTRAQRMSKQQGGYYTRGQWRNAAPRQSWFHDLHPELSHDANGKGYEFLFQKELRSSDVSSLGRIVLPKKDAERHLPFLLVREGMMISLEDYQSGTFWTVRYRFWPNNKSRMYLLENIGGFVTFHRLQEGDLLLCYRNEQGGYVIRGEKVPANVRAPAQGPNPRGNHPGKETTETTETMTVTNLTTQFIDGDQSTTNATESNSFDSLECSFSEGPANRSLSRQPIGYGYNAYEDYALKTGDADAIVEMLSVSNVKQRYVDGREAYELE